MHAQTVMIQRHGAAGAHAVDMLLHGAACRVHAPHEVLVAHGRAHMPPMVQYAGNMRHAGGMLHAPQGKVMIL